MVPRLDGLVEAECRQLLSAAATWIFSTFWLLHPVEAPQFPFEELLQPIAAEVEAPLREKVAQDMCTRRGGDPEIAEADAGAEGSGAGGADAEGGAPPM